MIIDACMFYNELEMLELRMNELDSVVDQFVIVEAEETIGSGVKRRAVLPDNWDVVKPFEHKVRYTLLPRLEPVFTGEASGWLREAFQRNELLTSALRVSTSAEDVLIASDCDEIPRANVVTSTLPKLTTGMHRLDLDLFYYNVNRLVGNWPWGTTIGTIAQYQVVGGSQNARAAGYHDDKRVIGDAGWHFSYFGGLAKIKDKVEHFSHASEGFCKEFLSRDDAQAAADISSGKDLYRRETREFARRESTDSRLPAHFLRNPARFKHFTETSGEELLRGYLSGLQRAE
jgi:beta-1,4-mannosyl-glycoprotein beta-1,4-N-acetylglucosaminyltransferase